MKTQIYKILVLTAFVTLAACSEKAADDRGWTADNIKLSVDNCKAEILAPPARASEDRATRICSCYTNFLRGNFTFDQYSANPDAIDQEPNQDQAYDQCIAKNP